MATNNTSLICVHKYMRTWSDQIGHCWLAVLAMDAAKGYIYRYSPLVMKDVWEHVQKWKRKEKNKKTKRKCPFLNELCEHLGGVGEGGWRRRSKEGGVYAVKNQLPPGQLVRNRLWLQYSLATPLSFPHSLQPSNKNAQPLTSSLP